MPIFVGHKVFFHLPRFNWRGACVPKGIILKASGVPKHDSICIGTYIGYLWVLCGHRSRCRGSCPEEGRCGHARWSRGCGCGEADWSSVPRNWILLCGMQPESFLFWVCGSEGKFGCHVLVPFYHLFTTVHHLLEDCAASNDFGIPNP